MNSTSCDCGCNGNCRRQVAYDESETNCINVENANGVQYLESPESPDPRSEFEATQSLSTDIPEPEPETESVEFSIMTSENEDGLALKKRKMDETEMENESYRYPDVYDSDSSKDSEHQQQLLSERAEEAEMKFDDAKLRIVNLMAQKTLSIRELASIMSFASQAFDNIYKDIEQGKYKEVAGGDL